jgi:signal transduction histidine kinase
VNSLPLRTRLAVAFGVGFFVLGALLLVAVAVFVAAESGPATDEVIERLADDLGVDPTSTPDVKLVAPGGRSVPAMQLPATVREVTDDVRRDVGRRLALMLPALAAVAAGAGWWLARRSVRPLEAMTEVARRVSSDRLDARIDHVGPRDEIHDLADAVDRMMERLERAFEMQGAFAASVSHELRTPLAIIRTELDVLLGGPDPTREDLEDVAAAVREALDRSERTIDALLVLARSGIVDPVDDVDLARVVSAVIADTVPTDHPDLEMRVDTGATPTVHGDAQLVRRLVGNLVDNAVRHNLEHDGWVHVDVRREDDEVVLIVANSGPVLSDEDVERLGEPFYRGVSGRRGVPGTGLGLGVARAIANGHGGTLDFSARPAGGLRVELRLPASRRQPPT